MSTTMKRIRDRLTRACSASRLQPSLEAELAVAAADVGDGRAADELEAIAAAWRRIAASIEGQDRKIGRTYGKGAEDLEDRVGVLRAVPQLRRLVAERSDLAVTADEIALECLTAEHDVVLTLSAAEPTAVLVAAARWCGVLSRAEVDLWAGVGRAAHRMQVTGMFQSCSVRVGAQFAAGDPVVTALVGRWLPQAGERTRVYPADLAQLAAVVASTGPLIAPPASRTYAPPPSVPGNVPDTLELNA